MSGGNYNNSNNCSSNNNDHSANRNNSHSSNSKAHRVKRAVVVEDFLRSAMPKP